MSDEIIAMAAALRRFLDRHNVPGRARVRLVIVAEESRTAMEIERCLRMEQQASGPVPFGYVVEYAGIAIAVRSPKLTVEV